MSGGGGGGTTATTVYQETSLSKAQAAILKELSPYILDYGKTNLPQLNELASSQTQSMLKVLETIDPTLGANLQNQQTQGMLDLTSYMTPMLMQQLQGQISPQQMQNQYNVQNTMRSNAANMGVGAGDPRMAQNLQMGSEGMTKPSGNDTMGMLMQLFGTGSGSASVNTNLAASQASSANAMNPTALLSMMGQGGKGGSSSASSGGAQDSTMSDVSQGVGMAASAAMIAYLLYSM
jgi:hypothetical protein